MSHDFDKSLARSQAHADEAFWEQLYRAAFPGFASMMTVRQDGWAQRGGIDRVITLASGKTLAVEEKVRSQQWPDILLEYAHTTEDGAKRWPGWIEKDLACDFIAYTVLPAQTCYLLPFLPLRRAWVAHGKDWIAQFASVRAQNQGYVTHSVAVPTEVLLRTLQDAMRVSWGSP